MAFLVVASTYPGTLQAIAGGAAMLSFTLGTIYMWLENVKTGRLEVEALRNRGAGDRSQDDGATSSVLTEPMPDALCLDFPHQEGCRFVHELFERTARCWPNRPALRIAGQAEPSMTSRLCGATAPRRTT